MGFGFLVLLISFVPLSRARDLRTPPAVDRRSAPDPLLGEIFNDPTATSLTKLNLEDNDNDTENNVSGSGSELWLGSGRLPKPSRDSSETVASHSQQGLQTNATQTASSSLRTNTSPNRDISSDHDTHNIVDNTKISELTKETPQGTNVINTPPTAQNVPQQSSTSMPLTSPMMTSQGVDLKLPATEDQSQNKVVQSEESATTTKDTSATSADIFPSKSQTLVENFAENPAAGFIGRQTSPESAIDALGFDDNSLYDPTIVKKTDIPNGLNMVSNTLVNNTMEIPGNDRSTIPKAPMVPKASAVPKSAPASVPYKGSFPLELHKYSPSTKLIKKNIIDGEAADFDQQYIKKDYIPSRSVIPGLSESGGLRPLMVNLPQQLQQQQDSSNTQAPPSLQLRAPFSNQSLGSFGDQPQVMPPTASAAQPFAPVASESPIATLAPPPTQAILQTPEQVLDQAQTGLPQASVRVPVPSDMQSPAVENTAAAFPMNATINSEMAPSTPAETAGIPVQGAQVMSVYKGLTPKKPTIDEDQCEDQFETCPEMAKNDYCTKYPDLMKIQCKKSCKFCPLHTRNEPSAGHSSGYDEYSESGSSIYYDSDQASGSGSSDWSDNSDEDDTPEYKKASIPRPIHKVLMSKFSGDAGSDSEESGDEESADSADDATQTSGSGEAASGSQKKDLIKAKIAASGSGEAVSASTSSTASAAEIGSSSGSLAEDLATGTVSKANEKHNRIPQGPRPQQESVYPKIDLKEIAKAVNLYRGVALKMLGEALEGAAQEKEDEISKKSRIPLPPATKILQKMGFPVGVDFGAKRDMIPNGVASNYGMIGYGNNGYAYNYPSPAENEPLADFYNQYQQEPNLARSEIMASPEEPDEEDQQPEEEGAAQAQDEHPEEIQPAPLPTERVNKHVEQQANTTTEVTKETKKQENLQSSQNNTSYTSPTREPSIISYIIEPKENWKKSEITDPFEYVRNMGKGASMEPIRSQTAASASSMSHSDPIILWKNSHVSAISALARKKSTIPQPASGPVMPAFTQTMQETFQAAPQQFRSDIPSGSNSMIPLVQQNITSNVPEVPGQAAPLSVPVFPQNTPQSEAWTQNAGDSLVARSQIENVVQSTQQSPQQEEGLHARLRPQQSNVSAADLRHAIPQGRMGSSLIEVSTHAPIPGSFPLTLRKIVPGMDQKKDELYKQVQAGINRDSVPLGSVDFVANKKLDFPAMSNSVPRPAQMRSAVGATRSTFSPGTENHVNLLLDNLRNKASSPDQALSGVSTFVNREEGMNGGASSLSDNTDKAADLINEALTGASPAADNQQSSEPLIGSLESKITALPENPGNPINVDSFSSPGVEISGKIPGGSSLDGLGATAITRAQVSHASGGVSSTASNIDKGVGKQTISGQKSAANLPPLHHDDRLSQNIQPFNHGVELAGALPPLNHNMDVTSNLPPLNHAKEEAANLPPLLHGIEQAGNLPSLNHGTDVLHGFHDLPPLNHGKEQAENLPPLNHGIESNRLPPLSHGSEAAGNLPPLLLGVEQASHMPSPSYEKQASQGVESLSAFASHTDNVAPLGDHGEMIQSYVDKLPQSHPLLQHAYPVSNALLPSVNHQQLPPLNHNDLIATEASRFTGSKDNVLSTQGQTRSKSPPPLYPFTIPPEGEEESQGYHAERGRENYHETAKASSQASARGLLPMRQAKKPIIPAMKPTNGEEASFQASTRGLLAAAQAKKPNNPAMKPTNGEEPAASRQLFPEGGQPYPMPLPPEGSQNDPVNMDSTANNPVASRQLFPEGGQPYPIPLPPEGSQNDPINMDSATNNRPFDNQLLEDPNPLSTSQLPDGWKKGNINPEQSHSQQWSNYPMRLPLEKGQSDPATPSLNRKQIGKKNLIRPKPDLQCGTGWTGALGDFGSFCYKEVFEHKTWDTARHACRNLGGDLFSVTNAYEQRFLENFTNIESWLGYRDKSRDGTWSWSDSSLSVFTNWDSSTKNDHGKGRDCVLLNSKEGKWNDASCLNNHAYLCKKKAEDCSKGWKKLTLNTVRGCYKLFKDAKSWEQALVSCMNEGASLSSILSDDEQTMISQVYSKYDFWIGYNDIDNEGDWVWSDRMTSSYTNWDDKSPNNGGVSCAIVTRGGKWHDEPCQSQFSFICKKPSPNGPHHPLNDATLTQEVQKLVSNKSLLNPDIDTTVTIFGRHPVTPQYFWTVQKIFNNRIHGSNTISAHGNIKSVDGGVQLNGINAWLDAGDFYGQCLGDPDLCIKGFSFALQLNFDDDALSYKDKRYILDSSGSSRGVSIFIQNGSLYYKVVASTKEWQLSTELVTNEWQDIVITWKKEEGLMLYVNGAFRDSLKDGTPTNPVPNKQARLTIGRKSGNPPFKYTRMYISSLYAFTRFLAPEDVPYVFTLDDTVVPRYMWLLPHLTENALPGSPDIEVHGVVRAVDGGVHMNGKESFLKVGNFEGKCLHDPSKCPDGLSVSCKLKFNKVVRTYKEPHYILDSGGHQKGIRGLSAYLLNNNLYFSVVMSTEEDTLTWTVRTSIFTVRWQRVVLSWSLAKGLWLYTDSQFRGWTKTPKSVPRDVVNENSDFIIGGRNVEPDDSAAEFSIGSLAVFPRFLEKKDVEKVFGGKKMPYPGLIREVWKELPGKSISKLKDDPYYPNDPSLIEIIENFDSPFDIDKDYGSRVKGYFVAPETGNYTFYMSGSQSGELWLSGTESQQNLSKLVSLGQPTGHNQWNKYAGQISKSIILEAGKYYYITGLQKGTESTDSLSAGVHLPSGRFMRPITKEILQWRMPGDPFAGVIREVWQDIPGYRLIDLTSNPNFPNNPSSIEVLDKFDAPHNVDDNYGSRIRGFFKAPESGQYRFFLAADTTGELWLSADETEKNLKKVVTINGWTAHNEWLKFPEQKSERIHLKKGKYYYMEAYQKAEKLADCVSVAVELPSGHFEGPIKRVHLSWRLPDGKTGPGPSSEEEAIPKPVGLYPLNKAFGAKDAGPNNENGVLSNVDLTTGPDGKDGGAYEFKGTADSFVEIPNDGKLDIQNSMTLLANIFPTGTGGPILNYKTNGWGVHLWQFEANELFVRFVHRNGIFHKPLASRVLQLNEWNQVGATYDNTTGVAQLWHNGKMVKSRNIGQIKLATQYAIRIGAKDGDERRYSGKISCLQIYNKALDEQQIGNLRSCPVQAKISDYDKTVSGDGSGSGAWEEQDSDSSAVSFSHNAGKYDKDEEADDEIQGSESTSGNKCDPQPCENGGKCVRDSKRLDGYRCKCTSDFTGRNCQVSKPDAENPIVKKAKIPKPEIKTGSEDYQRNASSLNIIENVPEEKKEDILLLFQKVGCFKDESVQHDLPSQVTVKSVTQEECVRSCALQEKGYSYFGLQSADRCFCGHRYGKYGKADDSLCNMPCQGNNKENCGGNSTNMVYFFGLGTNYTVSIFTGDVEGASTDAKVYVTLYGEKGDSGFRKIDTKHFERGKKDTTTLILPDLGQLRQVRILHDNTGAAPSWFLDKVMVADENGLEYEFPCKEWLSETQSGGKTERLLRLKSS